MSYCTKCGKKNEDDAEFCSKCGASLTESTPIKTKGDDCVCESNNKQNPLVPVFWGIAVILVGLWILVQFVIPDNYLPLYLHEFNFCGLVFLIIAIGIILTGIRVMTKK